MTELPIRLTVRLRPHELDLVCNGLTLLERDYVNLQSHEREIVHRLRLRLEELARDIQQILP